MVVVVAFVLFWEGGTLINEGRGTERDAWEFGSTRKRVSGGCEGLGWQCYSVPETRELGFG